MPKSTRVTDPRHDDQAHAARRKAEQSPSVQPATGQGRAAGHVQRLPDNPGAASAADMAQLQTRYGNRAVQRLLASHTVQAKLEVGPANDRYEQEADHVAQQVMRMPAKDEDEQQS